MISHFTDDNLNSQIEKNGFAVVPFATVQQIEELQNFYHSLPEVNAKGTYVTMFHPSYEYRKKVEEKIRKLFAAKAESYLNGYRVLYTNLMIKEPGPEGDFPVHQDWTYVDESHFASYAFWIPLQNVDTTNGVLHVVRGSHKFITALRGPYVYEPFKQLSGNIKMKHAEPINLKAGEALIWDHRLIHFSLPNLSSLPRMAFTLIAVPKATDAIHCFGLDESRGTEIQKYLVDTDFFLRYIIGTPPEGVKLLETVSQRETTFSEEQFIQMLQHAK
ncbi:MAG: phytanoyl-CoA dioxygenase family protein [Bacteroidota bacterium]